MTFDDNWLDSKNTFVDSSSRDAYQNTLKDRPQGRMEKEKPFGVLFDDINFVDFNFDTSESVSNTANSLSPSIGVDSSVNTANLPIGNFDLSPLLPKNNDFSFTALGSTALLGSTELLIARSAFPAGVTAIATVASSPIVLGTLGVVAVGTAGYYLYDQFSITEPIDNNYVGDDHLTDRGVPGSSGKPWGNGIPDDSPKEPYSLPGASLDDQIIYGANYGGGTLDPSLDPSITTPKPLSDFDFSTPIMMSVKKPDYDPAELSGLNKRINESRESNSIQKIPLYTDLNKLDDFYEDEEFGAVFGTEVTYLNDKERKQFKLHIENGKLYDNKGLFDTADARLTEVTRWKGHAIFVMDEYGSIYASNKPRSGKFHHSSFLSGNPVAIAGEIVVNNGEIIKINRQGSHYKSSSEQLDQFTHHLNKNRVNLSDVFIDKSLY